MFRKLLKYDILSVARLWWIVALSVPAASVIGALALRFLIDVSSSSLEPDALTIILTIFAGFVSLACATAVILSGWVTIILIYVRFYKNLFSDEGYLTFTLPVSRKQILLSKTLNAFIWNFLHSILYVISLFIYLTIAPPAKEGGFIINTVAFEFIGSGIKEIWNFIGGWSVLFSLQALIISLIATFMTISVFHLSITIGSIIVKKAKIVASIGIYYGINIAISMLFRIIYSLFGYFIMPGFSVIMSSATKNEICLSVAVFITIFTCVIGIVTIILYNITQHLLERKLNLS